MNSRIQNQLSALKKTREGVHQQVTVSNGAAGVAFTAFDAKTTSVLVSVSTQAIRVRFDGTAPTATVGHALPTGYIDVWSKELAEAALFIRSGGSDGKVDGQPLSH